MDNSLLPVASVDSDDIPGDLLDSPDSVDFLGTPLSSSSSSSSSAARSDTDDDDSNSVFVPDDEGPWSAAGPPPDFPGLLLPDFGLDGPDVDDPFSEDDLYGPLSTSDFDGLPPPDDRLLAAIRSTAPADIYASLFDGPGAVDASRSSARHLSRDSDDSASSIPHQDGHPSSIDAEVHDLIVARPYDDDDEDEDDGDNDDDDESLDGRGRRQVDDSGDDQDYETDSTRSHISVHSSDEAPEEHPLAGFHAAIDSLVRLEAAVEEQLRSQEVRLQVNRAVQRRRRAAMDRTRPQEPTIIDLTAEPDSPVMQQRTAMHSGPAERRPRGPPRQPTFIDLTDDAHDDDIRLPHHNNGEASSSRGRSGGGGGSSSTATHGDPSSLSMRLGLPFSLTQFRTLPEIFQLRRQQVTPPAIHHHAHPSPHINNHGAYVHGSGLASSSNPPHHRHLNNHNNHTRLAQQQQHQRDDFGLQILGQRPLPLMANPLLGNPPELNYQANGILNMPSRLASLDKPQHVPPPPAREGFTRDTGDAVVAVCASCDEELQYNPDESTAEPPAKRARTRKDREEHHFWAVTACGHVYCRRCYDNRRNAIKGTHNPSVGFQSNGKAVLCAVDGCKSDVTAKRAWVGLFL